MSTLPKTLSGISQRLERQAAIWRVAASDSYAVEDGLLKMMELPAGSFLMGSAESDKNAYISEKPQHKVMLRGFRIGVTPITVEIYHQVMNTGETPPDEDLQRPIVNISWLDAVNFCNELSKQEGYQPCYRKKFWRWHCHWEADGYRLPTEAEWEYACRAGTKSVYSFGNTSEKLDHYAWHTGNSNDLQPVAGKQPNLWGLYDMHGNTWEWCWDWYANYSSGSQYNPTGPKTGRHRVLRGGSFEQPPEHMRSAIRNIDLPPMNQDSAEYPGRGSWFLGFRCVRSPAR